MATMRNKIPCSADRLGLLDPQMIKAVVEISAFQIGHQYLSENRVRIVEADDAQISSAVIGNSGLYEQTLRLKDAVRFPLGTRVPYGLITRIVRFRVRENRARADAKRKRK